MPWATNVETITLIVEDLAASVEFYAGVFDAETIYDDDVSSVFKVGALQVNLLHRSASQVLVAPAEVGDPSTGVRFVLTIAVPDVDAVVATLTERGVSLLNGPLDRPWGVRTASFMDPSGYVWEVAAG